MQDAQGMAPGLQKIHDEVLVYSQQALPRGAFSFFSNGKRMILSPHDASPHEQGASSDECDEVLARERQHDFCGRVPSSAHPSALHEAAASSSTPQGGAGSAILE